MCHVSLPGKCFSTVFYLHYSFDCTICFSFIKYAEIITQNVFLVITLDLLSRGQIRAWQFKEKMIYLFLLGFPNGKNILKNSGRLFQTSHWETQRKVLLKLLSSLKGRIEKKLTLYNYRVQTVELEATFLVDSMFPCVCLVVKRVKDASKRDNCMPPEIRQLLRACMFSSLYYP